MSLGIHRTEGPVGLAGRIVLQLVGVAEIVVAGAGGEAGGVADLGQAAVGVIGRPHRVGGAVDGGCDLRGTTERIVAEAARKAVAVPNGDEGDSSLRARAN